MYVPSPQSKTPVRVVAVSRSRTLMGIPPSEPVFMPRPGGDLRPETARDSSPVSQEPESYATGETELILFENARLRTRIATMDSDRQTLQEMNLRLEVELLEAEKLARAQKELGQTFPSVAEEEGVVFASTAVTGARGERGIQGVQGVRGMRGPSSTMALVIGALALAIQLGLLLRTIWS